MRLLLLMFLMLAGVTVAGATERRSPWPGPFGVDVLRVLDGDTVEVRFADGPCGRGPCPGQELNLRILNIDAPEAHRCRTRGQRGSGGRSCAACEAEHRLGQQAMLFAAVLIGERPARALRLRPDKYAGRVVGELQVLDGGVWISVGPALVEAGLAIPYDGRRKSKPWCPAERRAG